MENVQVNIFRKKEEAGLAVEYSEEALREAIIKLRNNLELREKLGRNALKAAITKYNWEKEEEKLMELYHSLRSDLLRAKMKRG
jgi:glycosyltransferase involved in cell wall biosynthesis